MDPLDLENINRSLDRDVDLREKIKAEASDLERTLRTVVGILNKIHYTRSESLPTVLENARHVLPDCQKPIRALADAIPANEFWRWNDILSSAFKTVVFAAALIEYLSTHTLISLQQVSDIIGIKSEWKDRLFLPTEDYLHGLINLVNELSRLAVNSVTLGNFEEPIRISAFVKDLFSGFSMLNLKNDNLRRRFDSLKYDVKKIEEVVYDVSLRGLTSMPQAPEPI